MDLILVLSKKSTNEPISLFKWLSRTEDAEVVVYLDSLEDKNSPKLDLQENGDANVIVGFCVENVSLFQKIPGRELKEVSPQHILLCLTGEGNLIIYYVDRTFDPSDLPETNLTIDDSNVNKHISPATISGKELAPGVENLRSVTECGAEPSSAQAGQGNRDPKETGYLGIENQGATCYMNSILQILYHIPYFRKAVYKMSTMENDMPSKSIPLALQSLFYKLQYSDRKVTTTELTESLGWSKEHVLLHQDVEEHILSFLGELRISMKGTAAEGTVEKLFKGHFMNYTKCINVDVQSRKSEPFYDLHLDVKGCRDVYDSFDKYTRIACLEGDNKYATDNFGLQDAEQFVLFKDLPPVLQLHLKRFEYDATLCTSRKINDYYEFPLQLDFDRNDGQYLSPDADRERKNAYTLHSVLVHSGNVDGGHYYTFIRPTLSDQWVKFDDERVTIEDVKRAMQEQYGVNEPTPSKSTEHSNAYVLIYIRESDKDEIFCDVDEEDLARHLQTRLEKDREEKEHSEKERAEVAGDSKLNQGTSTHEENFNVETDAASIRDQSVVTTEAVLPVIKGNKSQDRTSEPYDLCQTSPSKASFDSCDRRWLNMDKATIIFGTFSVKVWLKDWFRTDLLIDLLAFYSGFHLLFFSMEVGVEEALKKNLKILAKILEEVAWLLALAAYLSCLRGHRHWVRRKNCRKIDTNPYLPDRIKREEDSDMWLLMVHGLSRCAFAILKEATEEHMSIPTGLLVTHAVSLLIEGFGSYVVVWWYRVPCPYDGLGDMV